MKKDYSLLIYVIILTVFGIIMVYSSSNIWANYKFNNPYKYMINQSIFFIISLILTYFITKIKPSTLKRQSNLYIFISIILLILVLIFGKTRNGSTSWFIIGPFSFQPSELSKISLLIYISKYLEKNKINIKNIIILLSFVSIILLLIMLEPDFGTVMIIVLSIISLIFISGLNIKFFIYSFIVLLVLISVLIIIAPYRLKRITAFIDPFSDPLGSGFQIIQSLYAIGPGGLLGEGFLHGRQKNFYLPEPQTDFIFSIISEEFGFLGILIVSILYLLIFYKGIKTSLQSSNLFNKYLSFGLTSLITLQAILNISVVIGLIPVTGVTLPFISYGGSSLITNMISIAIILSIRNNKEKDT